MTTTNQNRAFFILSTKGGVGKSLVAKAIIESHRMAFPQNPLVIVDADFNVKAIKKSYPDAELFDLSKTPERIRLSKLAEQNQGRDILIDFAGGTTDEITKLMGQGKENASIFFDLFRKYGYKPTIIIPVNFELNSNLALKDIHAVFKGCADWFIVKNLRGVPDEEAYHDYFKIFEGKLDGRDKHPHLKDFVPVEFAVEHMGLDLNERKNKDGEEDGTTSNSIRIPNMPIDLAVWMDDSTPFSDDAIKNLPDLPYMFAKEYIDTVKSRFLLSDLFN